MKNIAVLGCTGSIGRQTLDVIRANPDKFRAAVLCAGRDADAMFKAAEEFRPDYIAMADEAAADKLRQSGIKAKIAGGEQAMLEAAAYEGADIIVNGISGFSGMKPLLAALEAGKTVALANKETLVTAGHIIMPLAKEYNVRILPVDSEHSAIFQSLNGEDRRTIDKILLTASGGPFRGYTREQMRDVKLEDALKHPNWSMGHKITIDSATMVNKGLEVMEARWLFDVGMDDVQIIVQPQSIIHSMVQFVDGGIIAQLGCPDMRLPIQYALYYPERRYMPGDRLDFYKLGKIDFEAPDRENFAGLRLAYEAGVKGGNMPTIFNAANEYAVAQFLKKNIGFLGITDMIEHAMNSIEYIDNPNVNEILTTEQEVYELLRAMR